MVELFAADIRQIAPRAQALLPLLDEERRARVRAFGDSRSALLTLAAGLLLYEAFGERVRRAPFERGARGKPRLPGGTPFNLTHAGDYAVLALSTQPVGIDLEWIRPLDWRRIAQRFYHPLERTFLARSLEPEADFFRIWTLKESFLKAEGTGFSVSPSGFSVVPAGARSACFLGGSDYCFTRPDAFPGYCLSVCSLEREVAAQVSVKQF